MCVRGGYVLCQADKGCYLLDRPGMEVRGKDLVASPKPPSRRRTAGERDAERRGGGERRGGERRREEGEEEGGEMVMVMREG